MRFEVAEKDDRYGQWPVATVSGSGQDLKKIQDKLVETFGLSYLKYAIIIDQSQEEYPGPEDKSYIYTLDCIFREVCEYMGKDDVLRELREMGWIKEEKSE